MTVSSTQCRVSYIGDGTTTTFTIPFLFYANADLTLYVAGSEATTGFSITGAGTGSGSAIFGTAPASGVNVQIILTVPDTQLVELADGTPFDADVLNQVNDRAIQAVQRAGDLLSRSVVAPDGDVSPSMQLPSAANRANLWLGFDGDGNTTVGTAIATALTQAMFNAFMLAAQSTFNQMLLSSVQTGNFTGTLTGFASPPSGTFNYVCMTGLVIIYCQSSILGTSNANYLTITGLPALLAPAGSNVINAICAGGVENGGASGVLAAAQVSGQTITLSLAITGASGAGSEITAIGNLTGWATSGGKGIQQGFCIMYPNL